MVSALEACRTAPATEGGAVIDGLLAEYGTDGFERVRQMVRQVLAHHRADGGPQVRITDRRPALRNAGAHLYMEY
ncbi:hypothetical protein [Streptomyces sp. NPDC056921]|uniref:hypothetical protein n=1 Tax=Streptomyces sp. NPDC056921 TaxID=3345966 RepID=UPI003629DF3B